MVSMKKRVISFTVIIILLVLSICYSLMTGSLKLGYGEFLMAIFGAENEQFEIIKDLRFPRILIALFAGAALSVSGALLQAVMKNPLADAGVIGISSGCSAIVLIVASFYPSLFYSTPIIAFIGGAVVCLLIFVLSWDRISGLPPIKMLLVGVALNAIFTGISDFFTNMASSYGISSTQSSLAMKTWGDVHLIWIYGTIGLVMSLCVIPWCNLLLLSDKTSKSIGFPLTKARVLISGVAVLLAAISTAVAGVISFVGLLVPHIGRILVGTDHKVLLPFCAFAGALLVLTADTIGRTICYPIEIPAATIMAIIGGPFLILILRKG